MLYQVKRASAKGLVAANEASVTAPLSTAVFVTTTPNVHFLCILLVVLSFHDGKYEYLLHCFHRF